MMKSELQRLKEGGLIFIPIKGTPTQCLFVKFDGLNRERLVYKILEDPLDLEYSISTEYAHLINNDYKKTKEVSILHVQQMILSAERIVDYKKKALKYLEEFT